MSFIERMLVRVLMATASASVVAGANRMKPRYLDRVGAQISSQFEETFCEEGPIPDCMFGMQVQKIEVSYNEESETLNGIRTSFAGGNAGKKDIS